MHLSKANPYSAACPSRSLIDLIGAKWTILVIGCLTRGAHRFSELAAQLEGVTPKALTQTLRQLERNGLVRRTVHPVIPPHVEYELTPRGHTLREPLEALIGWTDDNIEVCLTAQCDYDAQP
ncbi:helix-turn-helix domain-containing protein [Streptomyces sp. H10-C2]|uniref:winged helix-turn-helix transcriptional regulator n=1 Tax=unclassified Streptomyces TaxID=2593676 RepID=UPI0024B8EA09|nr:MULTISPECIES: helix-turn-helix domain-containing protein [unclassified Streptomyces]MDJ0343484.1 helix-turn-helix domain-containing protein [Streptomyces sp. PH10-H1]MDJ0371564.1 helix-turn-helix domain-containing protein [Streptomyces sp. H10-C2]